jgi:hypothetical protein
MVTGQSDLRLERGQLPENRQISKIAESRGIDLHVLMEYDTVSLDKIKFLYSIIICIISAHLFATGIALCRLSVFFFCPCDGGAG